VLHNAVVAPGSTSKNLTEARDSGCWARGKPAAVCCGSAPSQRSANGEGKPSWWEQISLVISACYSPPPLALASSWPAPAAHCTGTSSPRSATPFPPSDSEAADGRTGHGDGRASRSQGRADTARPGRMDGVAP
jgi:hypothetical protein